MKPACASRARPSSMCSFLRTLLAVCTAVASSPPAARVRRPRHSLPKDLVGQLPERPTCRATRCTSATRTHGQRKLSSSRRGRRTNPGSPRRTRSRASTCCRRARMRAAVEGRAPGAAAAPAGLGRHAARRADGARARARTDRPHSPPCRAPTSSSRARRDGRTGAPSARAKTGLAARCATHGDEELAARDAARSRGAVRPVRPAGVPGRRGRRRPRLRPVRRRARPVGADHAGVARGRTIDAGHRRAGAVADRRARDPQPPAGAVDAAGVVARAPELADAADRRRRRSRARMRGRTS